MYEGVFALFKYFTCVKISCLGCIVVKMENLHSPSTGRLFISVPGDLLCCNVTLTDFSLEPALCKRRNYFFYVLCMFTCL